MKVKFLIPLILFIASMNFAQSLDWSYKFGGSYEDECYDMEIDSSQNIYLTGGVCNSVNFDLKGGSEVRTANGTDQSDIFVAIYDPDMDLKKAFILNGSSWDYATDIEIDKERSVYISGFYSGTVDFNPSQETYTLTSSESLFFVAKYDSIGNFKWVKNISKKKDNWGPYRSVLFSDGNSTIYLSTPDTLCKIDSGGNIQWSFQTNGLAVYDRNSSFYILSNSLNPWDDNLYNSLRLIKIDTSGTLIFDKEIISNTSDMVNGFLTYDNSGKLLINGDYWGTNTFNGPERQISITNSKMSWCGHGDNTWDCPSTREYFAKFDTSGSVLWAYDFGDSSPNPYIIETTKSGIIYTLGFLNFSADFDPTSAVAQLSNSGYGNYIAKYDSSCSFLAAVEFMGGSYNDFLGGFKLVNESDAYICGHFFNDINLELNGNISSLYAPPPEDIFVAKYTNFDLRSFQIDNLDYLAEEPIIHIYPNPADEYIIIEHNMFPIERIVIQDLMGRNRISMDSYAGNPIYIGQLSAGVYLVRIKSDNAIIERKIVKYQ